MDRDVRGDVRKRPTSAKTRHTWGTLICLLLMISMFAVSGFAQSKEAKDKYRKALQQLDWKERIGGNGPAGYVYRVVTPPNPDKAEKLFSEAATLAPDWVLPPYGLGDLNFVMKRYTPAAEAYQKTKDLDDKRKQLDKDQRLDMLDQLGLSYAMARKWDKAEKAYLAAVEEDPTYAPFEYNLSCVYAEKGDLDTALEHLQKAWEHHDNMPKGQSFPDPRTDDSYRQFWDHPKFKAAVRDMVI